MSKVERANCTWCHGTGRAPVKPVTDDDLAFWPEEHRPTVKALMAKPSKCPHCALPWPPALDARGAEVISRQGESKGWMYDENLYDWEGFTQADMTWGQYCAKEGLDPVTRKKLKP